MAEQATPYLIGFGRSGMVAHENRWLSLSDELVIAENVTFENDYAQKEPAATQYDPGLGIVVEAAFGTFSGATDSTMAAIWLPATTATALNTQIAATVTSTTSPWVVPITASAAAGQLVVVAVGQRTHPTDNPILTALIDSKGNIYTRQKTSIGSGTVSSDVEIWTSILTTGVTAADGFTLTFTTAAADDRACTAAAYTSPGSATSQASSSSAADTSANFSSAANTYAGSAYPALLVAAVHLPQINTTTVTWAGGFTGNAQALSGTVLSQLSLASKLVIFAPSLLALVDFKADVQSSPAGTVSTVQNSTRVVGAGTAFQSFFAAGDEIQVGGEIQVVASITNSTNLDTIARWVTTSSGAGYVRRSGPRVITASLAGRISKELPTSGGGGLTGNLDFTTLVTGLSTSRHRGRFIQGGKETAANNRKLFYFNGVDPVQVLSGDAGSMSAITSPPSDWANATDPNKEPINGLIHRGRLIGFGNLNDPHRIYFSDTASHEVFTGSNAFQISLASNVGERLYGAAEYQGVAWFWKYPAGIFYLDDIDIDFANWAYRTRSEALGCCASPHAVLPIDQDVIFCTSDGHFHLLSAVSDLGGQRDSDLTRRLGLHTWTKNNIDTTRLDQLCSVWDPVKKHALFGVKKISGTQDISNDLLLRWDFGLVDRGGPIRFSYATCWQPNALALKRRGFIGTPSVLIGENNNAMFVDPNSYGFRVDNAVTNGIKQTVQTPALDFADQDPAHRSRKKSFRSIEIVQKGTALATQTLTLIVLVDNVIRMNTSITISQRRGRFDLNVGDGWDIQITLAVPASSTVDVGNLGIVIWYVPTGQDHSRAS